MIKTGRQFKMQDPKEKEIPPTDDATGIYEFPPDDKDKDIVVNMDGGVGGSWYEISEEELREIYTNHEEGS